MALLWLSVAAAVAVAAYVFGRIDGTYSERRRAALEAARLQRSAIVEDMDYYRRLQQQYFKADDATLLAAIQEAQRTQEGK